MSKISMSKFWEAFIKIEILLKIIRSKWLYVNMIIIILAIHGFTKYKQFVYIPQSDSDYRIENYSLGEDGEKPFYQTEKDYEFVRQSENLLKNRIMKYISASYYRLYKKHYKTAILYTQNIVVSEKQFPDIYWMVTDACDIIGLKKVPLIFIGNEESDSIILTGYINPKIIIGSDFLWAYKPEELRFLIARKIVHVKCKQIYLLDMVKGFGAVADSWMPDFFARYIFGNMGIKFLEWYREAQITADRGALAITGDVKVATNALIKSNIGSNYEDMYGYADPDELVKQLDKIESDKKLNKFAIMAELRNPTPFVLLRIKNLMKFYKENELIFK